jgi:tripartite-type tricarboxylate transporter receptor subunit TctC
MHQRTLACGLVATLAVLVGPPSANAQAPFYTDKTISIFCSTGTGTTYDQYARLTADHLGRFLPGKPRLIVQSRPGAGGAVAAAYMDAVAPRDGTAIAIVQQNVPLFQALTPEKAKFDLGKVTWIGALTDLSSVLAVYQNSPAKSIEEARRHELNFGASGHGSETFQVPTLLNATLGTRFKVVTGFKDISEIDLAIERGELVGRGGSLLSWTSRKQDWIRDKKIRFIVQIGIEKDRSIPDVPLMVDLAKDDKTRQMYALLSSASAVGRSLFAPPGIPADRARELRSAFDTMVADPAFLADAKKRDLTINPSSGVKLQEVVAKTIATPKEVVGELRKILGM